MGRSAPKRSIKLPVNKGRKPPDRGGVRAKILRALGIVLLCVAVAALAFAAGGYLGLVKSVDRLEEPGADAETHPTYIYSAPIGGNAGARRVIGTVFEGENRKTASLAEMPPYLLDALVAKEDERFREHGGVDLWGIMRALYVDLRAGEAVEGASTITQQYVKNAYLSQDRSISRKLKEALIAVEIERREESKDGILADYLNTVYYGNNAYGVEAAAETYFDKPVEDLGVAESATLVGLLWSPSTLGEDRAAAGFQRDLVLEKMFSTGYLTDGDYTRAREAPMPRRWPADPVTRSGLTAPPATRDFAQLVQEELISRYGVDTVLGGGLSVYTTLDLEMQETARETLYGPTGYLPDAQDPDAALVSIEPGTGYVRAMVGNRDPDSRFNLVVQGRRQPGSSFKPFALIAALEQGIDPQTEFVSEKKEYRVNVPGLDKPEKWKVENYDGIVRGEMTLEEALWWSDNTVFTDLVMNADGRGLENGPEKVVDVAKRLGVTADFGPHPQPSMVLGAQEVSPLDMATAYATIANDGRWVEPTVVSRVVSNEGREGENVLLDGPPEQRGEQVIDPEIARQATEIMIGDVTRGIAGDAALGPRPVAGKTGTSENFFDAWFIGYTPQLVTGLWMGYGEGGRTLEYTLEYARELRGLTGGITPAQIWATYSQEALRGEPVQKFRGMDVPQTREAQAAEEARKAAPEEPTEASLLTPGDGVTGGPDAAPGDLTPETTTLEGTPGDARAARRGLGAASSAAPR